MMQKKVAQFHTLLQEKFDKYAYGERPVELYEPIRYMMSLGGKRLRPMLTLLGYQLFKEDAETILDQAMAMEVFHNFTLMHDDIMDKAPLRRGKMTVHEKWDANTAILSGDVMLVKAYDLLLRSSGFHLPEVIKIFNKCAAEVCEGQQLDMVFETKGWVSEQEYIEMITLKTAVLLGASLELGALLADSAIEDRRLIREFGINIGIGFQLMDDLLDVYADKAKFGKQVGGDIIANKKTFLLINALEKASPDQKQQLNRWLDADQFDPDEKVAAVTAIYNELDIKGLTENLMMHYFNRGFAALKKINAPLPEKAILRAFAENLINRQR